MRKQQFFPKFADREVKAMVKFAFQPTIRQLFSIQKKGLSVTEDPSALCLPSLSSPSVLFVLSFACLVQS